MHAPTRTHTRTHARTAFHAHPLPSHPTPPLPPGLYGSSSVRLVTLKTGAVERQVGMDAKWFGEGIAKLGDSIYHVSGWAFGRAAIALGRG